MFFNRYSTIPSYYDGGDGYLYLAPSSFEQRRRNEEWQRRQYENELRRRLQQERMLYRQRQNAMRGNSVKERMVNNGDDDNDRDDETQAPYRVVMGPDGNVYALRSVKSSPQTSLTSSKSPRVSSGSQHKENLMTSKDDDSSEKTKVVSNTRRGSSQKKINPNQVSPVVDESKVRPKVSKITMKTDYLVEDASDSESEESSTSKIWRNRRPSPGEWMEPVEYFR
jgi:hypothetical protein